MTTQSCSDSRNKKAKLQQIPFDLVREILLKLPAKSKPWDSTFNSPDFTDSFFNVSSSHPKILFSCLSECKTFFFSSPQPRNSCPLTASFLMSFPNYCPSVICRQWYFGATKDSVQSICNLRTGQFLTLPKIEKCRYVVEGCLGYDPIGKQLKVLCITESYIHSGRTGYTQMEHQVLTLGIRKKLSWRTITCDIRHGAVGGLYDGICINGVLYYFALVYDDEYEYYGLRGIVCFDVRSEKFSYIKKAQGMKLFIPGENLKLNLVNYKGKLATLHLHVSDTSIQLWVLEDAEKHQWSSLTYVLPPNCKSINSGPKLRFAGMTKKGEIVLSPEYINNSFYLVYYNPERNTITKIGIQGMEDYKTRRPYIFLDHVEDVKLMTSI